jgi:hypothetical protein
VCAGVYVGVANTEPDKWQLKGDLSTIYRRAFSQTERETTNCCKGGLINSFAAVAVAAV